MSHFKDKNLSYKTNANLNSNKHSLCSKKVYFIFIKRGRYCEGLYRWFWLISFIFPQNGLFTSQTVYDDFLLQKYLLFLNFFQIFSEIWWYIIWFYFTVQYLVSKFFLEFSRFCSNLQILILTLNSVYSAHEVGFNDF